MILILHIHCKQRASINKLPGAKQKDTWFNMIETIHQKFKFISNSESEPTCNGGTSSVTQQTEGFRCYGATEDFSSKTCTSPFDAMTAYDLHGKRFFNVVSQV